MNRIAASVVVLSSLGFGATVASAQTVAYWRHEEGTVGGLIPAGGNTVLDSSGNGNHMQTFNPAFTSGTYSSAVSPVPLRSGLPNTMSIDFGPGGDDAGLNDDNYTDAKPISGMSFSAMTIEVAFRMDAVAGYQAILGQDGKPTDGPVPPFKVLIRGDDFPDAIPNQIFVEWIDGDGDVHFLASGETVVPNVWYHTAITLGAADAALYVAGEDGNYVQRDALTGGDFAGPSGNVLVQDPAGWSIGRGMFNGGVADWADAAIDEARISSAVLTPDQFLFVPEPASGLVFGAAGALLAFRRRRATA